MEKTRRILPPEVLLEEYRTLLQCDGIEALPLVISGNSMSPFLIHGRDTVYLSKLTRPAKRGDVLLYQRENRAYVLHRVYKIEGNTLTMIGDAQTVPERGIRPEQVIAVMTSALRKGRRQAPGCFWWAFFEKVWIRMIPLRCPVRGAYTLLTKPFRH